MNETFVSCERLKLSAGDRPVNAVFSSLQLTIWNAVPKFPVAVRHGIALISDKQNFGRRFFLGGVA